MGERLRIDPELRLMTPDGDLVSLRDQMAGEQRLIIYYLRSFG